MILELAQLLFAVTAFTAVVLVYRRAGDVLHERRCARIDAEATRDIERRQRTDDVEALRKDLVAIKSKVNAMALKAGFNRDD